MSLYSITNHARDVVPAYRPDQIEAMLAGDFSNCDPTYVDAKTGEALDASEVRKRLARAAAPVFATTSAKVNAAVAAHQKAQALMAKQHGFSQAHIDRAYASMGSEPKPPLRVGLDGVSRLPTRRS